MSRVVIDGVEYCPVSELSPAGNRCVVVVDRGWIFAGDVEDCEGRIRIRRAIMVMRWEGVGFDGVLANPKQTAVKLRPLAHDVDLPSEAELFRVPVGDSWGL